MTTKNTYTPYLNNVHYYNYIGTLVDFLTVHCF